MKDPRGVIRDEEIERIRKINMYGNGRKPLKLPDPPLTGPQLAQRKRHAELALSGYLGKKRHRDGFGPEDDRSITASSAGRPGSSRRH